jgi:hypothetical protein
MVAAAAVAGRPGPDARGGAGPAGPHVAKPVTPDKFGEIDCIGLSPIQRPVKPDLACADPRGLSIRGGRFYDNGHYIGYGEPPCASCPIGRARATTSR